MIKSCPSFTDIQYSYSMLGYEKLDKDSQVNLFAWRNLDAEVNKFECYLGAFWKEAGLDIYFTCRATTYPGKYWLLKLINPKGAAIIKEGQYKNSHKLGLHKGKEALVQRRPVTVYRDKNKDLNIDRGVEDTGLFGINIHRSGVISNFVDAWSAGCLVTKRESDMLHLINICKRHTRVWNNSFNLTVLNF